MTCQPLEASARPDGAGEAWSEVDLGTFFDVSLDLLVVRELDGTVVKASASWATLLGYRPDEIEGQGLLRLIHPEDLAATRHSIVEVETRRPGDPVLGQVNRYRHRQGHYITLEWRAQRHGDRIYAVARDVTDKVAAERDLIEAKAAAEAASRAKSDFLANMSHEIRTPLNGVIGIVDALSRTPLSPDQSEMVALIASSGVTLERLVSDILDVSKIEAGQLDLETRPFDLDEALAAPLDVMRLRAEDKGLDFVVRAGAGRARPVHGGQHPHQAGAGQPAVERRQIHPSGRDHRRHRRGGVPGRRRPRDADGGRHRRRLRFRSRRAPFRPLQPGRRHHHAPVRRHRPGAVHLPLAGGDDGRADRRGLHPGRRQPVRGGDPPAPRRLAWPTMTPVNARRP